MTPQRRPLYFHAVVSIFFFYLLFSSPKLSSRTLDVYHTSTVHTWCGLSANLECRSEMCGTRLAENAGPKKVAKIAIWAPSHNFVGYIFARIATKARINNRKNLLSSNMSFRCPHNMVNIGSLAAEIGPVVWGTPANFNGFRVSAALLHGSQVVSVSQTLRR